MPAQNQAAQKPPAQNEGDKYRYIPKPPSTIMPQYPASPPTAAPVPQAIPRPPQHTGVPVKAAEPVTSPPPPRDAPTIAEMQKSSASFSGITATSIEGISGRSRGKIEDSAETCKEQLQIYLEVCDSIANDTWQIPDIIDMMHVMVVALNFDVIAVSIVDFDNDGNLLPPVCRGLKFLPDENVLKLWSWAVVAGHSMSWNKLMSIAADNQNDLAKWIVKEGLDSIGYVPIHDCKAIYGFILVATHGKKNLSPLASPILELCGGRLGLTISLRRCRNSWNPKKS